MEGRTPFTPDKEDQAIPIEEDLALLYSALDPGNDFRNFSTDSYTGTLEDLGSMAKPTSDAAQSVTDTLGTSQYDSNPSMYINHYMYNFEPETLSEVLVTVTPQERDLCQNSAVGHTSNFLAETACRRFSTTESQRQSHEQQASVLYGQSSNEPSAEFEGGGDDSRECTLGSSARPGCEHVPTSLSEPPPSSKAVAMVRFWISQSEARLPNPSPSEICSIANLTSETPQRIELIFGNILRGSVAEGSTCQERNANISVGPLTRELPSMSIQDDLSGRAPPELLQEAAQWTLAHPVCCRPSKNLSRSSNISSRTSMATARDYQCTLGCNQQFERKDLWQKHEEIRHPTEAWVCHLGQVVLVNGNRTCTFCGVKNPSLEHFQEKRCKKTPCLHKPLAKGKRIFYPEQAFKSHWEGHRGIPLKDCLHHNRFDVQPSHELKCPFCNYLVQDWKDRIAHILAEHHKPQPHSSVGSINDLEMVNTSHTPEYSSAISAQYKSDRHSSKSTISKPMALTRRHSNIRLNSASTGNLNSLRSRSAMYVLDKSTMESEASVPDFMSSGIPSSTALLRVQETQSLPVSKVGEDEESPTGILKGIKRYLGRWTSLGAPKLGNSNTSGTRMPSERNGLSSVSSTQNPPLESIRQYHDHPLHPSTHSNIQTQSHVTLRSHVDLERALEDCFIGGWIGKGFLPRDAISRLVTRSIVCEILFRQTLENASHEVVAEVDLIVAKAACLFAILATMSKPDDIRAFVSQEVFDSELPLLMGGNPASQQMFLTTRTCQALEFTRRPRWSRSQLHNFLRSQWSFISPIFPLDGSHLGLSDDCILPFIESQENTSDEKFGGYSSVYGVRIHPAHQSTYSSQAFRDRGPLLAMKKLHSRDFSDFENEVRMLQAFSALQNSHLIQLYGTYKHKGSYHLIFPHAEGNLRSFWEEVTTPWHDPGNALWMLQQLRGIGNGLNAIHNFSLIMHRPTQPQIDQQHAQNNGELPRIILPRSPQETTRDIYGRHGDIKPENILWSLKDNNEDNLVVPKLGNLLIADFGLMKFHRRDTRSRVSPKLVGGTRTYAPPEIEMVLEGHVSRAYDIWGFGCVALEFLTWSLEGAEQIYKFAEARTFNDQSAFLVDTYYKIERRHESHSEAYGDHKRREVVSAIVNPSVVVWMDRLLTHERGSALTRDLLVLIKDNMLVVDMKKRTSSQDLVKVLDQLLEKATGNPEYILPLRSRQNVQWSKKSALRYDSSTEDLRINGGKRPRVDYGAG